MNLITSILSTLAILVLVAVLWKWRDIRADRTAWRRLTAFQPANPAVFDPATIAHLPEPAQRYFNYAIKPGTPLLCVADISMQGEFNLGSKEAPNFWPMKAQQVLAAPHGFVWKVQAGKQIKIAGSDAVENGKSWSRFWLLGLLPVARAGGDTDHFRAAFGRYVAEAVFWTPAALLPRTGIKWSPVSDTEVRVTLVHGELEQSVDLTVATNGQLEQVVFQRWSNANPKKTYQFQPFGGYLSEYKKFNGFRLPTQVTAGNFFGTDEYVEFYRANVTSIRFP